MGFSNLFIRDAGKKEFFRDDNKLIIFSFVLF